MCQRINCNSCGKPSFQGCGQHVEQVLGDVAHADRCGCNGAQFAPRARSRSFLSR